jgi:hypothetical protein
VIGHTAGSPATLRFKTIANLVGWTVAGVLVAGSAWFLGGLVPVFGIFALVVGPYAAGSVIGDHIERWPGWAAAVAAGTWSSWWLAGSSFPSEDRLPFVGLLFISLLISVTTARYRWRLRPNALHASASR